METSTKKEPFIGAMEDGGLYFKGVSADAVYHRLRIEHR